ncbi:TPA: hypothetical protein ACGE8N_003290 [Yersinia enterocolitica]|jgi:hypothetical protein|uniref:hypothetical protein n=1 Tax=Yersinia enterocolitica TaxID=630 RepID=UPI00370249BA|nr:hypothetical protein [Yersinia enterocolitica]
MFDILKILITALVTLVFTGIIGNKILIKYQRDNWLYQQKFQNNEKDLKEFEKIINEISLLVSARIFRMRIYIREKISDNGIVSDNTRNGYIKVKEEWNEKINSFYYFFYIHDSSDLSLYLEREIQRIFVDVHNDMRNLDVKRLKKGNTSSRMDLLSNKSNELMKMMDKRKNEKRSMIYDEAKIYFTKDTLNEFSTFFLIKALFYRFPKSHSISRPPFSSDIPSGRLH